jgi:hypothetical protein
MEELNLSDKLLAAKNKSEITDYVRLGGAAR